MGRWEAAASLGDQRACAAKLQRSLLEPFLGGGALFFHLMSTSGRAPKSAVLADTNARLIRAYKGVRDDVEKVLHSLKDRRNTKDEYYRTRGINIDSKAKTDAEVAAWLIYLNKTGYNGLYGVNSKNGFNVPFGRYEKPGFYDPETLRRCADALEKAASPRGFRESHRESQKGRLRLFRSALRAALRNVVVRLVHEGRVRHRGTGALARSRSLSQAPWGPRAAFELVGARVFELYKTGFVITPVQATRVVNSKASGRGSVTEVLIE